MKMRFQLARLSGRRLFLRLPLTDNGPMAWWCGDPQTPHEAQSGELDCAAALNELPDSMRPLPAVLWLPAEQCVLEPVSFSGKSRLRPAQLAQLLGESLGEDLDDFLWWCLPTKAARQLLLGCPAAWLNEVLSAINACGLHIVQLLPELAALPDDDAVITFAGGRWLYRERDGLGAWLHPGWVTNILPQWRDPAQLTLYGPAPIAGVSWAAQHADCGEALLARCSADCAINLLSQLPTSLQPRSSRRYWPWTVGLAAATMVLALGATLTSALHLHLQASQDKQQISALYKHWLPQDKREDADEVDRLRRHRRSFIQQFGNVNFFNAFCQYAQFQSLWQAPRIQKLVFDDKSALVVEVNLSEADAKRAAEQAKQAHIAVKFGAAAQGRITATFTLRGPNDD
ncbi:type II secretion system protein GspL [Pantoea stewartii]|uniref:Type II secretion system protein L n=1 Tax=Pantoea stewartii subsp. stewartii DC283 TaxID=660596 RepID=H3RKS2_PANSE|nr:type II secretion system protein GspL [Pantoea stewartii]ARF52269.1 general secretion pathway protein GspL [Pantoea stewartii subsp. stewartii DC283]EHT97917.1 general secretion pathway protein L [Pantoea stewartii subsp. stewartii DC283]KAB0556804.1 general secretion pathway protein GspL [Pantoea stewartii subsp. stewartii]